MPLTRKEDRRDYDRARAQAMKDGTYTIKRGHVPGQNAHIEQSPEALRFRREAIQALREADATRYERARKIIANQKKHPITHPERISK